MGSLPEGGIFAVDTTNRFFEMTIPKDAPGLNGTDNFYVELFTVGESSGAGASESIPSDSTIQFTIENTSTDITNLTAFHPFNVTIPPPPDTNIIKIDGSPDDWKDNNFEPLATDTDNAQDGTAYKMDSLYVHMDSINVYFGFVSRVEFTGLHYGIYIDTDSLEGSGATSDKWGCDVTAANKHLPDVAILWLSWRQRFFGRVVAQNIIPGRTAVGSITLGVKEHFLQVDVLPIIQIWILWKFQSPRDSPGFQDINSFYISLFNFGGDKFVCETVPSDPAVNFTGENSSTSIEISKFSHFYTIETPSGIDLEILPKIFT